MSHPEEEASERDRLARDAMITQVYRDMVLIRRAQTLGGTSPLANAYSYNQGDHTGWYARFCAQWREREQMQTAQDVQDTELRDAPLKRFRQDEEINELLRNHVWGADK